MCFWEYTDPQSYPVFKFFHNSRHSESGRTSQWHKWIVIDIQVNLREENNPWCGTRLESRWGTFWLVPPKGNEVQIQWGYNGFYVCYIPRSEMQLMSRRGPMLYLYPNFGQQMCRHFQKNRVYQLFSVKNVYHGTDGWDIPTVSKSILQFSSI